MKSIRLSKSINARCYTTHYFTMHTALDTNKMAFCIFLVMSKTFDIVALTAQDFLISYLSNRYHYTKINGKINNLKEVIDGIPQGTILGPILFNVHLYDLYNI